MSVLMVVVVITVIIALAFDFVNGFHDAANSIATVVSTRVLKPQYAVLWAAFFNLVAMFIFAPRVADTIAKIVTIDPDDKIFVFVVLFGLLGAIIWDLLTWWWKLPTSSSHALIGGFGGAGIAHAGWSALHWDTILEIVFFIFFSPFLGFVLGAAFMIMMFWIFRKSHPLNVDTLFRKGQLVSAALYSIGHGANDAQKTMGIMVALLFAAGIYSKDEQLSLLDPRTAWIIISCHVAIAAGTAVGGWRIVKTMGQKITKLKPIGGFCAEAAGTCSVFFATFLGMPVSTTHTITGAIVGVGSTSNKVSAVKWGIAAKIAWAWILTIPAAGGIAALLYYLFIWLLWMM